ncbi:MAG: hypothetical protein JHC84_17695 [Solirubrobacteraceae bacterium]|nr:hypothetical protein [Solirubrobacteraceae bacterium]
MEAATRLPIAMVGVRNGRLMIDGLLVDDETVVRLAEDSEEPAQFVRDALVIGARVLDREQAGTNTDFVRAEFERSARELKDEFTLRAKAVADRLDQKVDETFGPDDGHVTKALTRHFGDESTAAVQHKVRKVLDEVAAQMREDLRRQLTSDSADNPIVAIQKASLGAMKQNADQQNAHLRVMAEKMEAMKLELAALKAEQDKFEELDAERERGTAKGRTYEEALAEALDTLAAARGDVCDAVGDYGGEGGRKGDVVIAIDACGGPARGRVVFEAKNRRLSKKEALEELDGALKSRSADYAVLVVPSDEKLPARTNPLREFNGDKLFVTFDPDEGSTLALEVAYGLARARVLQARSETDRVDPDAVRAEVERAQGGMDEVRRIKTQLSNARTSIDNAQGIVDAMALTVRSHLARIDDLLAAGDAVDDAA